MLLVLHEARPTWAGALRDAKDTLEVTALSLNVAQRRVTRLWAVPALPSDACRVLAVPGGGGLVICRSLLMYVSQVRGTGMPEVGQPKAHPCLHL